MFTKQLLDLLLRLTMPTDLTLGCDLRARRTLELTGRARYVVRGVEGVKR